MWDQPSQGRKDLPGGTAVSGGARIPLNGPGWGWYTDAGKEDRTYSALWAKRQKAVVDAVKHSWHGYESYAWGMDELTPLSRGGKDTFGGMGATLIDSLDTLHMMGLYSDFRRARDWVATSFDLQHDAKLSLFEATIRIVGGLIAAFDASGDALFLTKAEELASKMLDNFQDRRQGIRAVLPVNDVFLNPHSLETMRAKGNKPETVSLAEFGSFTLEWHALSARTGKLEYGVQADSIIYGLNQRYPKQAFLPVWFNRFSGKYNPGNTYSVGGLADSYYEYLLKLWLLRGRRGEVYRSMWEKAMDEVLDRLVHVSSDGLTYVGLISVAKKAGSKGTFKPKMEHLACYLPGNLALGVGEGAVRGAKAQHYAAVAANLTYTCWQMYERMPTGLAPEAVTFHPMLGMTMEKDSSRNQLRPEAVESLYYLWRLTGDRKYRDWGWAMFQAFQKHSRGKTGYHSIADVNKVPPRPEDKMESFWLAETLKYFWLLFGKPEMLALDKYVLNTEAHPLRIQAGAQ
ncbi:g3489 [Coccomyxa elongata]